MIDTTNRQCSTIRGGSQSMWVLLQIARNVGIIALLSILVVLIMAVLKPRHDAIGWLYFEAFLADRFAIFILIGALILFRAAFRSVRRRQ